RVYFPGVDYNKFDNQTKKEIEADIKADFDYALTGIRELPAGARLGVYLAYVYYTKLFQKIKNTPAKTVADERIRVPDGRKVYLLASSAVKHRFGML
ncbi:MAG: phytoene/squalene synthase family protein, partial [Bacteroidota bacterium]